MMDVKVIQCQSSQYEAAIMALRQGRVEPGNNTLLLNHALLVSGRAEKSLGILNVLEVD